MSAEFNGLDNKGGLDPVGYFVTSSKGMMLKYGSTRATYLV